MVNFTIPEQPDFNLEIRRLETTDRAHADLFNAIFQQLLINEAYLYGRSADTITNDQIDALGNLPPGEFEPGSTGGSCSCEPIPTEEIQKIIDTITANGSCNGIGGSCNCESITVEEIRRVVEEMRESGEL